MGNPRESGGGILMAGPRCAVHEVGTERVSLPLKDRMGAWLLCQLRSGETGGICDGEMPRQLVRRVKGGETGRGLDLVYWTRWVNYLPKNEGKTGKRDSSLSNGESAGVCGGREGTCRGYALGGNWRCVERVGRRGWWGDGVMKTGF